MNEITKNTQHACAEIPSVFTFHLSPKHSIDLRVATVGGKHMFVAKDVCAALCIANTAQATARLDEDEKGICSIDTLGGSQPLNVLTESGLYSLVLSSRLPGAKAFKKWVTSEVLPALHKTGSYAMQAPANQFNVPTTLKDALKLAIEQCEVIEKQQAQVLQLSNEVKEAAPKVEFYNDVTDSTNWLDFTEASKALNYGRTGLYRFLRTIKMLMKDNLPMQKYVDSGHFKTNVYTYYTPNGAPAVGTKLYVSGKGLTLISKRVIENPQVASVMLKRVKAKES